VSNLIHLLIQPLSRPSFPTTFLFSFLPFLHARAHRRRRLCAHRCRRRRHQHRQAQLDCKICPRGAYQHRPCLISQSSHEKTSSRSHTLSSSLRAPASNAAFHLPMLSSTTSSKRAVRAGRLRGSLTASCSQAPRSNSEAPLTCSSLHKQVAFRYLSFDSEEHLDLALILSLF
jgi:hypothetical protein